MRIDFVRDCGADPTGVRDCAPSLRIGIALALQKAASPAYGAAKDFTLHVPPGVYRFATTLGLTDMIGISTFRIEGHRAASIFLLASGDTGTALMGFANQLSFEMDGITFLGNGNTNTPDVAGICVVNSNYRTSFTNIVINSVVATYYGLQTEAGAAVHFENCLSANSACPYATGGTFVVDGARSASFIDCTATDNAQINGDNGPAGGVNRTGTHKNTICVRGSVRYVYMRGVFTDEACITGIAVGDGTGQIGTVEVHGAFVNAPVFSGGDAALHVRKARTVRVQSFDHYTSSAVPLIKLAGVDRADLRNVQKNGGASPYVITADAACGWLRVADPIGFGATDIDADTAIPTKFIDQLGTVTPL